MKQVSSKNLAVKIGFFFASFIVFLFAFLLFCSFQTNRMADDFLKQLGISKTGADEKIAGGFLGGSIDMYGVKNAKNILLGNRKAVAIDLLTYTKKYASSPAFIKQYTEMKERYKPTESIAKTPETMKAENIAAAKKFVTDMEAAVKKADASSKKMYENLVVEAKKALAKAEDPNNKHDVAYAKNYEGLVKSFKENYEKQLADWERKYPTNHLQYIKVRLLDFLEVTKDIDFAAELTTKNGKKYFVNPAYERMDSRRKMAFRAGKEVVEPAREFVQKWVEEIK
jgi:hypothetical protein